MPLERPSASAPQILVCIDHSPKSVWLLRVAKKWARDIGGGWSVVYVETPQLLVMPVRHQGAVLRTLSLAEKMGAKTVQIENQSKLEGIATYTQYLIDDDQNSQVYLFVGNKRKKGILSRLKPKLGDALLQHAVNQHCIVNLVPLSPADKEVSFWDSLRKIEMHFHRLLIPLLIVAGSFCVLESVRSFLSPNVWAEILQNMPLLFLLTPMITALRWGFVSAFLVALLTTVGMREIYHEGGGFFGHEALQIPLSLLTYFAAASIVSVLCAYTRSVQQVLMGKQERADALYKMYRSTSDAEDQQQAFAFLSKELKAILDMDVIFFLPEPDNKKVIKTVFPQEITLSPVSHEIANRAWQRRSPMGLWRGQNILEMWFQPLMTTQENIGVIGYKVGGQPQMDPLFLQLVAAVTDQAAAILERIDLRERMSDSRICEEREKLRSMLLSSLSHDLKTPLSGIIGSLSLYKSLQKTEQLRDDYAEDLTNTALEEAERLHSFINNILDMTRIESGAIRFNLEWNDPIDLLNRVRKRMAYTLRNHKVKVVLGLPHLLKIDGALISQVLQNVLDNAVKYAPAGSQITILSDLDREKGGAFYSINDQGPGIPKEKLSCVFDKFERIQGEDNQVAGTGLGLAICAQIIHHHKGEIYARNREVGGTEIVIWLPEATAILSQASIAS